MTRACAVVAALALPLSAAVGLSTAAQADPPPTVTITKADYQDKLFAMWQAENIANWTGLRTELKRNAPPFYTEATNWMGSSSGMNSFSATDVEINRNGPLNFTINLTIPWGSDDDTDLEYGYLWEMADVAGNIKLSARDIAHMWTTTVHRSVWYSDSQAEILMEHGALPPAITHSFATLWRPWIDVNLVVESFGAYTPGRPDVAMDVSYLPIRTVAGANATHTGQFEAIMYALAAIVDQVQAGATDLAKVTWMLNETLKYLPPESTSTQAIEWMMDQYFNHPTATWEEMRDAADVHFRAAAADNGLNYRHETESRINLAAQVGQLLWSQGSLREAIKIGSLWGYDSDNPTASNAGLIGLWKGSQYVHDEMVAAGVISPGDVISERYNVYRTRDNLPDYLPLDSAATDSFTLMAERGLRLAEQGVQAAGGDVTPTSLVIPLNEAPADRDYPTLATVNPDVDVFVTSANAQAKAAGTPPTVRTNLAGNSALYATDKSKWPGCSTGFNQPQMCSDIVAGADPALMADGAEADTRGLEEWGRIPFFVGALPTDEAPFVEVTYPDPVQAKSVRLSAGDKDKTGGWITDARVEVRSLDAAAWRSVPTTPSRPIDPTEPMQELELEFPGVSEITGVRVTFAPWGNHLNIAEVDAIAPSQFAATALTPNPPVPLDLDELKAAIASAAWLDAADFDPASWTTLSAAIDGARTLVNAAAADPDSVSLTQASAAVATVRSAIGGLTAPRFPDALALARAELAKALADLAGRAQADYTPQTWTPYASARAAATAALANPSASESALRSAMTALTWAAQALKAPVSDVAPAPAPTVSVPAPGPTVVVTQPPTGAPGAGGGVIVPADAQAVALGATGKAQLAVPYSAVRLVRGTSAKLRATGFDAKGGAKAVTWTSSKSSVASVSKAGKVTAKKAGTATLTAKSGGLTAKVKVTVVGAKPAAKADKVAKVTVSKVPASMKPGQVAFAKVKASPATATKAIATFASSNTTVASVNAAGRIVARAPGTATIEVKVKGTTTSKTITVK